MRIIDKEAVWSVKWNGDQQEYDLQLSKLCVDGQHFIVVNPELDYDVLDLINIDVPLNDHCVKFKVGDGWVAKRFSPNWNGQYQIVPCRVQPKQIIFKDYADKNLKHYQPKFDAWDLKYSQTWVYDKSLTNGSEIDAVIFNYTENPVGKKVQGIAPVNNKFDIIFLSYRESAAQENYMRLISRGFNVKRVDGVSGILNAHRTAAELASTDMFYVVDADAYITDDFNFDFLPSIFDRSFIHVWHSKNPVNGLEYGYGGVKLFPRDLLLKAESNPLDVTTSLGKIKIVDSIACETRFNIDEFNTWKSAFRECVKLSSKSIGNQVDQDTERRLDIWKTIGKDKPHGIYALEGAKMGELFGLANKENREVLSKINDYDWLFSRFKEHYE